MIGLELLLASLALFRLTIWPWGWKTIEVENAASDSVLAGLRLKQSWEIRGPCMHRNHQNPDQEQARTNRTLQVICHPANPNCFPKCLALSHEDSWRLIPPQASKSWNMMKDQPRDEQRLNKEKLYHTVIQHPTNPTYRHCLQWSTNGRES